MPSIKRRPSKSNMESKLPVTPYAPTTDSSADVVKTRSTAQLAGIVLTSILMGLVFGTTFAKSHVFEPYLIRGQFIFSRFVMLKMFLSAMGCGALCLAVLSKYATVQFDACRKAWESVALSRGWVTGTITGTFILGAGMSVAGACPGMVLSQVGSGVPNSGVTVAGGLVGALIYGLCETRIKENWLQKGPQGPSKHVYFDRLIQKPYAMFAIILGVACIVFAIILEVVVPWKTELPRRLQAQLAEDFCGDSSFDVFRCPGWPPAAAGIVLGFMQIPACLIVGTFLGSATSYQVCASVWALPVKTLVEGKFPYIVKFAVPQVASWWQLAYCGSAVVSAFLWQISADDYSKCPGLDTVSAFVGGMLMLFGARMAAGCTSGHGISGCAIGMIQSFIGVPAMFSGGIIVGMIWNFGINAETYIPSSSN